MQMEEGNRREVLRIRGLGEQREQELLYRDRVTQVHGISYISTSLSLSLSLSPDPTVL